MWSSAYALFQVTGRHGYPNRLNHGYPIRLKSLVTLHTVGLYVYMFLKQNVVHVDLVPVSHCHNALTLYCTCLSHFDLALYLFLIVIHFDLVSVSDLHMV